LVFPTSQTEHAPLSCKRGLFRARERPFVSKAPRMRAWLRSPRGGRWSFCLAPKQHLPFSSRPKTKQAPPKRPSCKHGLSHAGERPFDGKAPTHAGIATVSKRCEPSFPRPNAPLFPPRQNKTHPALV